MMRDNNRELVLDTCPRLTFLKIRAFCEEGSDYEEEKEVANDGSITTLTLDLPSLHTFHLHDSYNVRICNMSCPKLEDVEFTTCPLAVLPYHVMAHLKRITAIRSQNMCMMWIAQFSLMRALLCLTIVVHRNTCHAKACMKSFWVSSMAKSVLRITSNFNDCIQNVQIVVFRTALIATLCIISPPSNFSPVTGFARVWFDKQRHSGGVH